MSFATPWALLGLILATVPLILHLVQRHQPQEKSFPAVRYLEDATRDQRRRLRLRDLLLLLLRTALIIFLVLAAAGARFDRSVPLGSHAPIALVLVVDNSASSATVIDGEPTLDLLTAVGKRVLDRASTGDRLWLLPADGIARSGTATELSERLADLKPMPLRLDLGESLQAAAKLIDQVAMPGEIVILSDAQRTAITATTVKPKVILLRPAGEPPFNRSIAGLGVTSQPWRRDGGQVTIEVESSDSDPVAVRLHVGVAPGRDLLVTPGVPSVERVTPSHTGWLAITATLPPDELRSDDQRGVAVRVAPPPAVNWDRSSRFINTAVEVLIADGRLTPGDQVTIGGLGRAASIVVPPEDIAQVGALNRSLAARGSTWQFGAAIAGSAHTDSNSLLPERVLVRRRLSLVRSDAAGDTLLTVNGEPWLVRSGKLVLVGSRFDPEWTELPIRAGFVPLVDELATDVVEGGPLVPPTSAGAPVILPPMVDAVVGPSGRSVTTAGSPWTAAEAGIHWLLDGSDTVAAISVGIDPRESRLTRASTGAVAAAWPGATVAELDNGVAATFRLGGRGDLRPLLLVLAALAAIAESLVAGRLKGADISRDG